MEQYSCRPYYVFSAYLLTFCYYRLCVFHKLLAFPVTGGGSNVGVIEVKLAPHTGEHSGVSWAESGISGYQAGDDQCHRTK